MITQKAYKFRIDPNAEQREQLAIEFGHNRFVWNHCLDLRGKAWETDRTRHNYVSLGRHVTELKRGEFPWLANAAACTLTQTLIDQDQAFKNFFEGRAKYPRYKSRWDRQSIRYTLDQRQIENNYQAGEFIKLPKLGAVKVRWSQVPAGTPKMATVSRTPDGRYFIAFSCEVEVAPLPKTGSAIGVDLGIKDVTVTSDGQKSGTPRHLKRKLRHLKRQQRRLARMQKGSNRRHRQRLKVARIHARIAASRADFLHKTTTALIRRADVLAIEDLHVKGMVKNHHLAGAIADVGMGELRRQLEYKAVWYGREVRIVDRWAPTSKACSECGSVQDKMPLSVREWACPDCGTRHDRDVNAARNILMWSTAGDAGLKARGAGKNLPGQVPDTRDEARTAEKNHAAARSIRAAA